MTVLRILVPVDGSVPSLRAVQHVLDLAARGLAVELHLINVQAPVRGSAAMLIAKNELNDYHRDEGMKALADAVQALKVAGIPPHLHVSVGAPGEVVLAFAQRLAVQLIVMGTRGFGGGVAGAVMGSVASDVVTGASVPVTLLNAD
ncbi:MAG: universal stress protein [Alphaproteobacteria bacterium]|nr:universal stress protein [Alphaproteobacteria bacterium]